MRAPCRDRTHTRDWGLLRRQRHACFSHAECVCKSQAIASRQPCMLRCNTQYHHKFPTQQHQQQVKRPTKGPKLQTPLHPTAGTSFDHKPSSSQPVARGPKGLSRAPADPPSASPPRLPCSSRRSTICNAFHNTLSGMTQPPNNPSHYTTNIRTDPRVCVSRPPPSSLPPNTQDGVKADGITSTIGRVSITGMTKEPAGPACFVQQQGARQRHDATTAYKGLPSSNSVHTKWVALSVLMGVLIAGRTVQRAWTQNYTLVLVSKGGHRLSTSHPIIHKTHRQHSGGTCGLPSTAAREMPVRAPQPSVTHSTLNLRQQQQLLLCKLLQPAITTQ